MQKREKMTFRCHGNPQFTQGMQFYYIYSKVLHRCTCMKNLAFLAMLVFYLFNKMYILGN